MPRLSLCLCLSLLIPSLVKAGPLAPVLQGLVDRHVVGGIVVLVEDRDKVLDLEAAGVSSLATKKPMQTDNLFWIASMTKSFTGAAFAMLLDEGKVTLDDPVEKFLPEFKGQQVQEAQDKPPHAPQHPITIREVLSHTSGVTIPQNKAFKETKVLEDDVAQIGKLPLQWEPGTKFQYNNNGINTAGRVIEVISGMPYGEFVQKRLLDPLGLKDTTFLPDAEQAKRLASSERMTADKTGLEDIDFSKGLDAKGIAKFSKGVPVPHEMVVNFGGGILPDYANHYAMPAGGLESTASDVGKFCQMLLRGGEYDGRRYLSAEALRQMSTIQTGNIVVNPDEGYGMGWFVKKRVTPDGLSVGSYGHRGARKTNMWIDPTQGLAVVIMVQSMDMTGPQSKECWDGVVKAAVEQFGKGK